MKILVLSFTVAVAVGCTAPAPPPNPEADINAFLQEFLADVATANADSIAANYANDVHILEDGRIAYTSREQVRDAIAQYPAQGPVDLTFTDRDVVVLSAESALVSSLFEQSFPNFSFAGASTMLIRKVDDAWVIHRVHTSTPSPRGDS